MRDAFGLIRLNVKGDGRVTIEQRARNGLISNTWAGATNRTLIERVLSHLRDADYPAVPEHRILMGARLRAITIESGSESTHTYPTEWEAAKAMPGYREAYRLLNSAIIQITVSALRMRVDPVEETVAQPVDDHRVYDIH